MKLPEQDGYYKYWDGVVEEKTIVKFANNKIYCFHEALGFNIADEKERGSYFIEPIEPIKFD